MRNPTQRCSSWCCFALLLTCASSYTADNNIDSCTIGDDWTSNDAESHVMLLQHKLRLSAEGTGAHAHFVTPVQSLVPTAEEIEKQKSGDIRLSHATAQLQFSHNRSVHGPNWIWRTQFQQVEKPILQQFSALPEIGTACLSSSPACAPKVAFMFEIVDTMAQPEVWDAFFDNAPLGRFSIYVERKHQAGELPFLHHGALEAVPVATEWCALLGGMMSLLHSALSDAQNEKFVFASDDAIPLKSFGYVYDSLVQKAPASSNFCGMADARHGFGDGLRGKFEEASGMYCLAGGGWHISDDRLWKAHQWSALARAHAELILTHAAETSEIYYQHVSPWNGCSDEVVPISALVAGLRAQGLQVEGDWDDLAQWNITNYCPLLAAWGGPADCTKPPRPTDIGLTSGIDAYCVEDEDHMLCPCAPYRFDNITLPHLRNLLCSDFMFARKFPTGAFVINGTEHVPLGQVRFYDLLMEAENGACA